MTRRLRRLWMGIATVTGARRAGFFIPYRYAVTVPDRQSYPEIAALFDAARPEMADWLARIGDNAARLADMCGPAPRPRFDQDWFPRLDAAMAWTLVDHLRPARVIEVGSGHSTRFVADALAGTGEHLAIDPAPRATLSALPVRWQRDVLSVDHLPLFSALGPGDVAFFDSSHILMPGTDVDLIFNRILPALAPGVLVHIHDVMLPDAYPPEWQWRGYNEQNALGPLLAGGGWRVEFASHYAISRLSGQSLPAVAALPLRDGARETSLWLRKL